MDEKTVYHINKNGYVGACKATVRKCPLGGEHYTNEYEALVAADKLNKEKEAKAIRRENIKFTAKVVAGGVAAISALGGFYMGMSHTADQVEKDYQVAEAKAPHTPYALSVQKTSRRQFSEVTMTSKDLKQTKLSNCVNMEKYSRHITCSSPDGKMSVSFDAVGKYYNVANVKSTVKDNGKTSNVNYKEAEQGTPKNVFKSYISMPKSSVN